MRIHSKPWLILELLTLMGGVPALLYWVIPFHYLLPVMWGAAVYAYAVARHAMPESISGWWLRSAFTHEALKPLLLRFALCAALLTLATYCFVPELLFSFALSAPAFWLLVMLLYPLLSVIPQEIIFRSFFFDRYLPLFPRPWAMVLASAICFGLAHLLFRNWVAPVLCLIGGAMFAQTYQRHRSLLLVAFEHALYGDFLFTVGLGRYFYHGSVVAALQ